jgi:hypothetical protein
MGTEKQARRGETVNGKQVTLFVISLCVVFVAGWFLRDWISPPSKDNAVLGRYQLFHGQGPRATVWDPENLRKTVEMDIKISEAMEKLGAAPSKINALTQEPPNYENYIMRLDTATGKVWIFAPDYLNFDTHKRDPPYWSPVYEAHKTIDESDWWTTLGAQTLP